MPKSPTYSRAAYFEEYNEDAQKILPETRQTANIAAKRSKPDFPNLKHAQAGHDDAHEPTDSKPTVTADGIGNRSREPNTGNPVLRIDTSVASVRGKSSATDKKIAKTPKSAHKSTLKKAESGAPRNSHSSRQMQCDCRDCAVIARSSNKVQSATATPIERPAANLLHRPTIEVPFPSQASRSSAPSPDKGIPIVEPAKIRPRPTLTQSYRTARPMSYHSGAMPEYFYSQPIVIEPQRPAAFPTAIPIPPPSYPPPKPSYFPPLPQTLPFRQMPHPLTSIPYEPPQPPQLRPQPHHWVSDLSQPPNRPVPYNTPPVVDYPGQPAYPDITSHSRPIHHPAVHRQDYPPPLMEAQAIYDEGYAPILPIPRTSDMPPPQRPTVRHAATTSVAHTGVHYRLSKPSDEHFYRFPVEQGSRRTSPDKLHPSKRMPSTHRPSAASSNETSRHLHPSDHGTARVRVESSTAAKQRRRASYYGHETPYELERVMEAYQGSRNADMGLEMPALTADSLRLVRKKTQGSDVDSRVSGDGKRSRDGSDVKARVSADRRRPSEAKVLADDDGFKMSFNASQGVNLDLKGSGVEGRTISLRPSKEDAGSMELSIGSRGMKSGSRNEGKEKHRKTHSYINEAGSADLEYARNVSRARQENRAAESIQEKDRPTTDGKSSWRSRTGFSFRRR